jgi:hypothetical protein
MGRADPERGLAPERGIFLSKAASRINRDTLGSMKTMMKSASAPCFGRSRGTAILSAFALLSLAIGAFPAFAQEAAAKRPVFAFDLPVFDIPYQLDAAATKGGGEASFLSYLAGYESPGMEQALALSADFYEGAHWGLKSLFGFTKGQSVRDWKFYLRGAGYSASLAALTYLGIYSPPGSSWLHEEFHRAVMTANGVDSFDMVYTFPFGSTTISVNRVEDGDLAAFKASNPVDFARMHVAGIEGEYLLVERLERGNFFDGRNLDNQAAALFSVFNCAAYVSMCSETWVDEMTDEMNAAEADPAVRDFTGFDFLGWTYDLFRPGEPYSARGVHPSGTGIDRYVKTTDLSAEELSYLRAQGILSYLNFLSPMLYVDKDIPLRWMTGREAYGNFALRHILTSSGSDTELKVFLRDSRLKSAWSMHNYVNYQAWFPAIEAEIVESRIDMGKAAFLVSPRLIVGVQPLDQAFRTSAASFFCYGSLEAELLAGTWASPFMRAEFKTGGWVAGSEYTAARASFSAGLRARF